VNMIAADVNLCATPTQFIWPRTDESFVPEDRDILRTADPSHRKCDNRFRSWPKSVINSHILSESDKQWQEIISGSPWPSSGCESQMGFMRIDERMNLGISDIEMIRNSPHTRFLSPKLLLLRKHCQDRSRRVP
jgi:hypothetical protein